MKTLKQEPGNLSLSKGWNQELQSDSLALQPELFTLVPVASSFLYQQ